MAEPKTRADRIDTLFPWLLHWSIADERLAEFRSDAYAVRTPGGWMLIDALPLEVALQGELGEVAGLFLTHGNHQRSAWRLRRELGSPVYVPEGATGLDEEPDAWIDAGAALPGGLVAVQARGFEGACYLTYTHADGTVVLFCGDLICQDPAGPYRFPVQPNYFDPAGGVEDARRILELSPDVLCAAHAEPIRGSGREVLQAAVDGVG